MIQSKPSRRKLRENKQVLTVLRPGHNMLRIQNNLKLTISSPKHIRTTALPSESQGR